ncbi:hypothetical protein P879_07147 [Paragonimus westermani]|uniref:Uncharacterized protein n=1 Tax=Paragonimus westermani TaxID=34504 RepID=A0A8T0DPK4_9TREM|nr:hypothetical protein P879_07147 [Paragonimus westermani]
MSFDRARFTCLMRSPGVRKSQMFRLFTINPNAISLLLARHIFCRSSDPAMNARCKRSAERTCDSPDGLSRASVRSPMCSNSGMFFAVLFFINLARTSRQCSYSCPF